MSHACPSEDSFIALLDQSGATLKEAMQLARHSDRRLTMAVYGRAHLRVLGERVDRLPTLLTDLRTCDEPVRATGTDDQSLRQVCATAEKTCEPVTTGDNRGGDGDTLVMTTGEESSPRRTQLEPGFIERGTLRLKRLRRAAVIEFIPWNGSSSPERQVPPLPNESRHPNKLARYYQSLLDSGKFENRSALARYLSVSRARVTQVLKRLT